MTFFDIKKSIAKEIAGVFEQPFEFNDDGEMEEEEEKRLNNTIEVHISKTNKGENNFTELVFNKIEVNKSVETCKEITLNQYTDL